LRQRLLDFDFAGEAALPPALPRGSSDQVARFVGGKARSARAWAPADEKLLGVRVDANGEWWSWNNTVALIVTALVRDGVVPETGADLYPELKTSRGYDAFFEMPAKERAARYLGGINPLTGKWYRSFSLHTDEPGGISIEAAGIDQAGMVVTSEGTFGVAEPAPLYPDPAAARPQISGALSVKLWSSDPAKLLLADLVTYSRPSQD
jgi:hypothetical protein